MPHDEVSRKEHMIIWLPGKLNISEQSTAWKMLEDDFPFDMFSLITWRLLTRQWWFNHALMGGQKISCGWTPNSTSGTLQKNKFTRWLWEVRCDAYTKDHDRVWYGRGTWPVFLELCHFDPGGWPNHAGNKFSPCHSWLLPKLNMESDKNQWSEKRHYLWNLACFDGFSGRCWNFHWNFTMAYKHIPSW